MHKSLSFSRQGTFDTGPAHLDKRGSIRRGDVELPVVEPADQPDNDPQVPGHTPPASQTLPPSSERGPLGSVERHGEGVSTELSPRYVDHNKLYPEPLLKPVPKEPGHAASGQDKRRNSKHNASPGRADQLVEAGVNSKVTKEVDVNKKKAALIHDEKSQKGGNQKTSESKSLNSGDTQKAGRPETIPLASPPGRSPESGTGLSPGGKNVHADKTAALKRLKTKTEQSSSHVEKEHQQNSTNKSTLSPRNQQKHKLQHPQKEHPIQQQQPQQQQPQQQQDLQQSPDQKRQTTKNTDTADTQNKGTDKTKTTNQSLEFIKRKQQQHQSQKQQHQAQKQQHQSQKQQHQSQKQQHQAQKPVPTTETNLNQTERPQPHEKPHQHHEHQQQQQKQQQQNTTAKTKPSPQERDTKNRTVVKPSSTSKSSQSTQPADPPSQQVSQDANPHPQPSPVLFSTQQGSAPPQDHSRKVSNPSSKKGDTPKDKKQVAKVTPQSAVIKTDSLKGGAKDTPRAEQPDLAADRLPDVQATETGDTPGDKAQSQGQPVVTTMADTQGKSGGLDSLAQVTSERDQLLRVEKTYKQRILQLEEEVKSAVKQSQELAAENRLLSNQAEAFETKVYGGSLELKKLRREKQDLVTMVAKTTGEKQEMDSENERLRSKLAEADSKNRQWDALYVENNKLKAKQAELEKRIMELENEKLKLKSNVKVAESTQLDKLATVQNENKKLQAELINLQRKNSSMERKVDRLEADNKDLTERMDQKKTELDELMRAMKTETNVELELKEVSQELEFAKNKIEDYKKDLNEANRRYDVQEKEKDSAKNSLRLKDSECKGLKAMLEEKDTQIGELKRQVDTAKRNAKRLEDDLEDTKQVEKDVVNMKARVRSLKNEIEDSLAANHKMKQERTEARLEADRLNRELAATSEALSEARRYIKKLEGERSSRDKMEQELSTRKQREQDLERQTYEINVRNEQLRTKVRILEEEKEELLKRDVNETHAANRKLQDENRKLRQMIVERNMEIVHRQSERHTLVDRVDNLERKQNDSEVKVQQLKGWVEDVYTYPTPSQVHHLSDNHHPTLTLPPVPSKTTRVSKAKGGDGAGLKRKKGQHLPQQQRQHQLNRSWEDLNRLRAEPDESIRTTPGLPGVGDSKTVHYGGQGTTGYYDLYKSKMKLIREKKW